MRSLAEKVLFNYIHGKGDGAKRKVKEEEKDFEGNQRRKISQ